MLIDQFPDRTITIEGKEYVYFGGTSYLGIATNKAFLAVLIKNIQKWGSVYGSSRNANVKLAVYDQFENQFAQWVKAESSLSVSSGTLAGKLVLETLANSHKEFFHYPKTHPAILAENSQPLFIENELHPKIKSNLIKEMVITTDAILSGEVSPIDFGFLKDINGRIKMTLVIDESHSIGITGDQGEGIFPYVKQSQIKRKVMISSLGKALGLAGGVIASDKEFIAQVKHSATFISASGSNPAHLQTFLEAQPVYKKQREKLFKNLHFVKKHLKPGLNCKFASNYPVIYTDNGRIYELLLDEHMIIARFKYPTYKKPMNRIVITANHKKVDLEKLIILLNNNL